MTTAERIAEIGLLAFAEERYELGSRPWDWNVVADHLRGKVLVPADELSELVECIVRPQGNPDCHVCPARESGCETKWELCRPTLRAHFGLKDNKEEDNADR